MNLEPKLSAQRQPPVAVAELIVATRGCVRKCGRMEMFAGLAQGIARAEPRTPESTTATTLAAWVADRFLSPIGSVATESRIEAVSPAI
jgi:hypothetical protein